MMQIMLRPLQPADEPFLWQMLYHAIFVPAGQAKPPFEVVHHPELSRYVINWGCDHDCGWLASVNQQPVGAVWLRLLTGDQKGYGFIDDDTPELSIAVLPDYRGQGIGSALLDKLCQSQCSNAPISLSVSRNNPAVYLYQRFGFNIIDSNAESYLMVRRPTREGSEFVIMTEPVLT